MLISLTNIAKYRRQANHIDESKFGDTEGPLAFGDDRKIFRGSNEPKTEKKILITQLKPIDTPEKRVKDREEF